MITRTSKAESLLLLTTVGASLACATAIFAYYGEHLAEQRHARLIQLQAYNRLVTKDFGAATTCLLNIEKKDLPEAMRAELELDTAEAAAQAGDSAQAERSYRRAQHLYQNLIDHTPRHKFRYDAYAEGLHWSSLGVLQHTGKSSRKESEVILARLEENPSLTTLNELTNLRKARQSADNDQSTLIRLRRERDREISQRTEAWLKSTDSTAPGQSKSLLKAANRLLQRGNWEQAYDCVAKVVANKNTKSEINKTELATVFSLLAAKAINREELNESTKRLNQVSQLASMVWAEVPWSITFQSVVTARILLEDNTNLEQAKLHLESAIAEAKRLHGADRSDALLSIIQTLGGAAVQAQPDSLKARIALLNSCIASLPQQAHDALFAAYCTILTDRLALNDHASRQETASALARVLQECPNDEHLCSKLHIVAGLTQSETIQSISRVLLVRALHEKLRSLPLDNPCYQASWAECGYMLKTSGLISTKTASAMFSRLATALKAPDSPTDERAQTLAYCAWFNLSQGNWSEGMALTLRLNQLTPLVRPPVAKTIEASRLQILFDEARLNPEARTSRGQEFMNELSAQCRRKSADTFGSHSLTYARALTTIAQYKAMLPQQRSLAEKLNDEALAIFDHWRVNDTFVLTAKSTKNALKKHARSGAG